MAKRSAHPQQAPESGSDELTSARRHCAALLLSAVLFSAFVNLLLLTGPLFMLQIYDRVLSSGSVETLFALGVLMVFLYVTMGLLDHARGRVMARVAARIRTALDARVFAAILRRAALMPESAANPGPGSLRDLDAVQRLIGSPVILAILDAPWVPVFLVGIFIFHPWLGWLAVAGGCTLVALAALNQWQTRAPNRANRAATEAADRLAEQMRSEAETIRSLGMQDDVFARWEVMRTTALDTGAEAADRAGGYTAAIKALRLLLQSAMLGLGAWLVLRGQLQAGAMIAASILLGRALAPIEQATGQWEVVQQGAAGWRALGVLLARVGTEPRRTAMPRPVARIEAEELTVLPPGERRAALRMVTFTLEPGQALGVIGPSGAGKSSLARVLTGVWQPNAGRLRLGGVPIDHYDAATLGRLVGYLPQRISLFDGTIAENIARLDRTADDAAIVAAAKRAGAHEMIVEFPDGYDTQVTANGCRLSGGQIQRIGLARAFYGNPVLLVLDEPNSNLDNEGTLALNEAIRAFKAEGNAVLIMAHRPAAIVECDTLLVLDGGLRRAFGPRDRVLSETVANRHELPRAAPCGRP